MPRSSLAHDICIKNSLMRDLIGYSMYDKQDNNVEELVKYSTVRSPANTCTKTFLKTSKNQKTDYIFDSIS